MSETREVFCRPPHERALWFFAGLGAAGAALFVVCLGFHGTLLDGDVDVWLGAAGLLPALLGIPALHGATARLRADAYGLHSRTLLRRRSVPWSDIADLHVRLKYQGNHRYRDIRRVGLVLHNGHKRLLPLPYDGGPGSTSGSVSTSGSASPGAGGSVSTGDTADFDATLEALRALHRRFGAPATSHLPVVSQRTAGHGVAGSVALCAVLLACAGVAAWWVPATASHEQDWTSAVPCTSTTPAAERAACLTTLTGVIDKTEAHRPRQSSWLYFADDRPVERLAVSREAAAGFEPGDEVELTLWHREIREVAGEHQVWREHVTPAGDVAVVAAAFALAAGWPAARVLLRLRSRRLPDDDVLPSVAPFVGVLFGTALWLLPLCYFHPTPPFAPVAPAWAAAGCLVTLALFAWAWRVTRARTPKETGAADQGNRRSGAGDVFLAARFLEHTDYNPHRFGTHIALGDGGPPAVVPGPGRFAAKDIPVERLTVTRVRRARGDDGDTVPRGWHVAELDDAGTPVRLAAAPSDLARLVRELTAARGRVAGTGAPGAD
ncbi:PH domain-containing protein [Streptomyces reniochalinae]|uniref:PH domain-containing protein n=1 Tax=Streptomyces reniochalinae TaxID=2250578 RepID=A0A367F1G0_9ACTN|nr:PH domain-containing protein [Streptomyces reniochalinae]RCG24206.1 PH domain-containing protein [Streptomyces reniochalinae]